MQMREKMRGSNHCSDVVVVGRKKKEEEEEEEKEENSQVLFSSGGPCGLGYSRCWAGYYRDDGAVGARQYRISG